MRRRLQFVPIRSPLVGLLLLAGTCLGGPPVHGHALTIGSVQEDVRSEEKKFGPFARYLEARLRGAGIEEVCLAVHTSIVGMAEAINRDEVDLYIDSPVLTALVARRAAVRPLLRAWKEGAAEYRTVVYVRKDSGIDGLEDLRGRTIAFKKKESTPGHYLPRAFLVARGLRLVELPAPTAAVPGDALGYVFSHGDLTSLAWVLKGLVAAAVFKDTAFREASLQAAEEHLVALAQTPAVPRQILVARSDLETGLVARIERVLLAMHEDEEGRKALTLMHGTERFDRFPEGATEAFERINRLLDVIQADQS